MPVHRPCYQGSVKSHLQLLEQGRAVLQTMSEDSRIQAASTAVLSHPGLHKRNIFVSDDDPTVISAVIDWQSASIEPAFWYADEVPDFARPPPDYSDDRELKIKSEACAKAFEVGLQLMVPKLSAARLMDESLFRPFRYCYRTWDDGAAAFREELIQTALHWQELGFTGRCPFEMLSTNELAEHRKDCKTFEAAHQLKHLISDLLNTATDGWVPSEH